MKKGYVYSLICPISKEIRYVGQTSRRLTERLRQHKNVWSKHTSHRSNWLKKLKKLNLLSSLQIILIEECDIDILNDREIYWIAYFKNLGYKLTNQVAGGLGTRDYKHTDETKKIIGEASKKSRTGTNSSDEARKNISLSLIGNSRHLNKTHSQETKDAISEKKKGSVPVNKKRIGQFINTELIKEWDSSHDAADELGLSQGNISQVATGLRKTCGGFIWKYLN